MKVQLAAGSSIPTSLDADSFPDLRALRNAMKKALRPALDEKGFAVFTSSKEVSQDEDVRNLTPDTTIFASIRGTDERIAPIREKISFQPHPKTLTMAGELEYWAAQGRSPLPYAISELIDNALRATQHNTECGQIVITLALSGGTSPHTGLVSVWDNGCGMGKQELNNWAVMNYSMEDRGNLPQEPHHGHGLTQKNQTDRFLSGNLSYFGVGSKNAAFFMGKCIKIATRSAGSSFVHELGIAAADLEERYKAHEDVYAEDLVHRMPGDTSTMAPLERAFEHLAAQWVQAETCSGAAASPDLEPDHYVEVQEAHPKDAGGSSFTRVMIGNVRPDVLSQIHMDEDGRQLCRDIKHLYHYYLHGPSGRRPGQSGPATVNDGILPEIVIQCTHNSHLMWRHSLVDVCDDMESKYLEAQKEELQFAYVVEGRGTVAGVLYYFPFENERENVPMEPIHNPLHDPAGAMGLTQQPAGTQLALTQARTSPEPEIIDLTEDDPPIQQLFKAPIFSAFWQGRLIPGARIDSLPFIEAVRAKNRRTAAKDRLPDEVFLRLRGSLFFGPSFLVTRNKLTFRDNLQQLLADATPVPRQLQKDFQAWLTRCHNTLDKRIRFKGIAGADVQAAFRAVKGEETTVFGCIADGSQSFMSGKVVRVLNAHKKAATVGRILNFYVQKAVRSEGIYADGLVCLRPLPEEVYGTEAIIEVRLRKLLDGNVLSESEAAVFTANELKKLPASLKLEPIRYASGMVEERAGTTLQDTSVVIMDGHDKRTNSGTMAGRKGTFTIVQRLWRLEGALGGKSGSTATAAPGSENVNPEQNERPTKKRKGKAKKGTEDAEPTEKLLNMVSNAEPRKLEGYYFRKLENLLTEVGQYRLEYELEPSVPGRDPLKISTLIHVSPGPAKCFKITGDGRVVMATREYMVGEHLPDLHITFWDVCGNQVEAQESHHEGLRLSVTGVLKEDGEPSQLQELQLDAQSSLEEGRIIISGASIMPAARGSLLTIFSEQLPTPNSIPQGQQQSAEPTTLAAMVNLCVELQGFAPVPQPVKLRPGPPVSMHLSPSHPFKEQMDEAAAVMTQLPPDRAHPLVATLVSGEMLGSFSVQAYDCCGARSGSCASLACTLQVACEGLDPTKASFPIDAAGRATAEGLKAAIGGMGVGRMLLSLDYEAADAGAEAALAFAGPCQAINLGIDVEPSTEPAALVLLHQGEPLPQKPLEGEETDEEMAYVMEDVPAGSTLEDLEIQVVDASGRPVPEGTEGKLRASWISNTKKLSFKDDTGRFDLLPLKVRELVSEPDNYDVKFRLTGWDKKTYLSINLVILKVPAEPAVWQLQLDGKAATQDTTDVRCGEPFQLLVEAHDKFGNRCPGGSAGAYPMPSLTAGAQQKLDCDPESWESCWSEQGGVDVCMFTVSLAGQPGSVTVHAQDTDGPKGSSRLTPDSLELNLSAGPMAGLAFEETQRLQCGLRDCIGALKLLAVDAYGNTASCAPFEVSLVPSALSTDGSGTAASVTVAGGNKTKLKDGEALFKAVRIEAEARGVYTIHAKSASRKVAGDASLEVELQARNAVTSIEVCESSVPTDGIIAGASTVITAQVATEDGEPLEDTAAEQGLVLRLAPAGRGRADEVTVSMDPGTSRPAEGVYGFPTGDLTLAEEYAVTAEFTETRSELTRLLTKKTAVLRSSAATFQVLAGPPAQLTLSSDPGCELAVTNGAEAASRLLLSGAALQLMDEHGNASAVPRQSVRVSLQWPPEDGAPDNCALPELEMDSGPVMETSEEGSAFYGDVRIVEGSGTVTRDAQHRGGQPGAMDLQLCAEVAGLGDADARAWVLAWSCPVVFSDNAASFAALKELAEQREALAARRNELEERLAAHRECCQDAGRDMKAAQSLVSAKRRAFPRHAPASHAAALQSLEQMRLNNAAPEPSQPQMEARFGEHNNRFAVALRHCMTIGDPEIIGCVATLGTIRHEDLNRLLSTLYGGSMQILIVESRAVSTRLEKRLREKGLEVPDVLALSVTQPYGGTEGDVPGFAGCGQMARELTQQACEGSDEPLAIPLPHTRAMSRKPGGSGLELGPTDWPDGCVNYAVNLVRPVLLGHRKKVLYHLLSNGLVFEDLEAAGRYREFVTQVLKSPCPQLMTVLDLRHITGQGVIKGSGLVFKPLANLAMRFGSGSAASSAGTAAAAAEEEANMEALADALRQKEEAEGEQERAQQEAEEYDRGHREELKDLKEQIKALDAQLGTSQQPAGGRRGKKRGTKSLSEHAMDDEGAAAENEAEPQRARRRR